MKPIEKLALRLLRTPPVGWDKAVSRIAVSDSQELVRWLNWFALQSVELSTYLDMRFGYGCGDQGHDAARKESQKKGKQVWTKVLGYNAY